MRQAVRRHPRIAAGVVVAALCVASLGVAAARSRGGGGCTSAPPVAAVPDQLRPLGDFDQPYPAGDDRTLEEAAQRAATALHPDLAQATPAAGDIVHVGAAPPADHAADLVLLLGPHSAGAPAYVEGVVAFLLDCSGQRYFDGVTDLGRGGVPPTAFPQVTRRQAVARLGHDVDLVHTGDPVAPLWRDRLTGATLPATGPPAALPGAPPPAPSP